MTLVNLLLVALLICPLLGFLAQVILGEKQEALIAKFTTSFLGISLGVMMLFLMMSLKGNLVLEFTWISLSSMNLLLANLILFVSFIVSRFSIRYMNGDTRYARYFSCLGLLATSAVLMVLSDNLVIFWFSWSISNLLLISLMVHKKEWRAAKNSGLVALRALVPGSLCLLFAILILTHSAGAYSLQVILEQGSQLPYSLQVFALGLITITALTQSAIWPFHRWLISSLNSPTPVSALMHAGLVNGGGILIVKFAPLFAINEGLLLPIFLLGALSAVFGTVWKLIQHDIKRMLACSTLAQMGFMMMQCGLGLFAPAIAHLCWHGLFKAYLFLSSGSAIAQKPVANLRQHSSGFNFLKACIGGILAVISFSLVSKISLYPFNTSLVLFLFVFMTGTQFMLALLNDPGNPLRIITGGVLVTTAGCLYGVSILMIELIIPTSMLGITPVLSRLEILIIAFFVIVWSLFNLGFLDRLKQSKVWLRIYMTAVNASQPAQGTITSIRTDYHY